MPQALPNDAYDQTALVFQGGGALGAFQAGAYEAFHATGVEPDWYAGISIGAINCALIAGNTPDTRCDKLLGFWNLITSGPPDGASNWSKLAGMGGSMLGSGAASMLGTAASLTLGSPGFFTPRMPFQYLASPGTPAATSYYSTDKLRETLLEFVDFDLLNDPKGPRVSLGVVDVETGNFRYFDNRETTLGPEHVMASGALPPGFPWVEIEGRKYWDGGLVSNTPLAHVLRQTEGKALVFQVDLFSARGSAPRLLPDVEERRKDIVYSSRTRLNTDSWREQHAIKNALRKVLDKVPEDQRDDPDIVAAQKLVTDNRVTLVHVIYRFDGQLGASKDYEFSRTSMERHWAAGLEDAQQILAHPCWREPPTRDQAIIVYDLDAQNKLTRRVGAEGLASSE